MSCFFDVKQFVLKNDNQIALAFGCFDILHYGHIRFFKEIKKRTTLPLCVGVLPDYVVSFYKGEGRPIVNEKQRVEVVGALKYVDFAFLLKKSNQLNNLGREYAINNDELPLWNTAICWLDIIKPTEFYYSSDFHMSSIISRYFSDNNINSIEIPYTKGISTSEIVKHIIS